MCRLISVTTDKTTEIELEFDWLLPTKESGGTYDEKLQKNDHGNVEESRRFKTAHDLLLHQSAFASVISKQFPKRRTEQSVLFFLHLH